LSALPQQAPLIAAGSPSGHESAGMLPVELAQVYEENFAFVWRNARRLGVPAASAQDVVQDVFMVVHRRLADFRGGPIRPWIFGILKRVVRDYRRTHMRKAARWIPLAPDAAAGVEQRQLSPSEQLESSERMQLLADSLAQLNDEQRSLIVLSELEQWTLRELAELFGLNINTLYTRLRAAKKRFAKAYVRTRAKRGDAP
jgi:RNA polymerase sigma-70 factor, ECF subfamily